MAEVCDFAGENLQHSEPPEPAIAMPAAEELESAVEDNGSRKQDVQKPDCCTADPADTKRKTSIDSQTGTGCRVTACKSQPLGARKADAAADPSRPDPEQQRRTPISRTADWLATEAFNRG